MKQQQSKAGKAEKSPGQLAYERDLAAEPNYQDGAQRRGWDRLGDVAKDSWERNPTDRNLQKATLISSEHGLEGYDEQGAPDGHRV